MKKRTLEITKHQAGLLSIAVVGAGFCVMYLGVRQASELFSAAGLAVTALGALAVVLKY